MKNSVPEDENKDELIYSDDYAYFEEEDEDSAPPRNRLLVFLSITAILSGLLLCGLLLMASPIFNWHALMGGDPEALLHGMHVQEESALQEDPMVEEPEETTEPTIPPEENPFNQYDFQYNRYNYLYCLRQESYAGVDVSAFQNDVDWVRVKNSGIQFAMLRLGYRGWGAKGTLVEDEYIQKNLMETAAVGLPIGAYFFSQATTLDEVREEIAFMLDILGDYPLSYPIVLDWEVPDAAEARTRDVDRRTLTDMLHYFCDEMKLRGFEPMVYFNWTQASRLLYLNELEDFPFWLALYQDRMTYPFRVEMWQYSCTGTVPGIEGDVDLNVYVPDLRRK